MSDVSSVLANFLHPVVEDLLNADMFNKAMQFTADGTTAASGDATFILSGPPVLRPQIPFTKPVETYLSAIGAVQNYSLNQGTNIVPFQELGSMLKRHAVGSGNYSASMSRVENKNSGFKWSLYQWLPKLMADIPGLVNPGELVLGCQPGPHAVPEGSTSLNKALVKQWVGLDSDIFNIPFGLLCITGSAGGRIVHVEYLESCYIVGSGRGASGGNPLIMPNISMTVTRVVPYADALGSSLLSDLGTGIKNNGLRKNQPYKLS